VTVRFYFAAVPSIAALDAVRSAGPRDVGDEEAKFADEGVGSFIQVAARSFAFDRSKLAAGASGEPVDDAGVAGDAQQRLAVVLSPLAMAIGQ
jgi:hypothetical protein